MAAAPDFTLEVRYDSRVVLVPLTRESADEHVIVCDQYELHVSLDLVPECAASDPGVPSEDCKAGTTRKRGLQGATCGPATKRHALAASAKVTWSESSALRDELQHRAEKETRQHHKDKIAEITAALTRAKRDRDALDVRDRRKPVARVSWRVRLFRRMMASPTTRLDYSPLVKYCY